MNTAVTSNYVLMCISTILFMLLSLSALLQAYWFVIFGLVGCILPAFGLSPMVKLSLHICTSSAIRIYFSFWSRAVNIRVGARRRVWVKWVYGLFYLFFHYPCYVTGRPYIYGYIPGSGLLTVFPVFSSITVLVTTSHGIDTCMGYMSLWLILPFLPWDMFR